MNMDWLSAAQAAEKLGVSERQVRRLAAEGDLESQRIGAAWLIAASAVRDRARCEHVPGRPLSPAMAWAILWVVDHLLRSADSQSCLDGHLYLDAYPMLSDRRARHRLRGLLAEPPPAEHWAYWLRRRADPQRLWVHPGVLDDLRSDHRLHAGGADAAIGLGGAAGGRNRYYVTAKDYESVLVDHHAQPASDGQVHLMVVPPEISDELFNEPGRPALAAAGLVDCLGSPDAREHHLALVNLSHVASGLAQVAADA
jgi:excisionase family DNA binding protein